MKMVLWRSGSELTSSPVFNAKDPYYTDNPAVLLRRENPAQSFGGASAHAALKAGGKAGGAGTNSHYLRGLLVTAEVALAMVALIGAGLFLRSFQNARGVQPGFDRAKMSMSQFYLPNSGYSRQEQHLFCRELRERMERQPGVIGMTYSDVPPRCRGLPPHPRPRPTALAVRHWRRARHRRKIR